MGRVANRASAGQTNSDFPKACNIAVGHTTDFTEGKRFDCDYLRIRPEQIQDSKKISTSSDR
jgi:hypothetical protein